MENNSQKIATAADINNPVQIFLAFGVSKSSLYAALKRSIPEADTTSITVDMKSASIFGHKCIHLEY